MYAEVRVILFLFENFEFQNFKIIIKSNFSFKIFVFVKIFYVFNRFSILHCYEDFFAFVN